MTTYTPETLRKWAESFEAGVVQDPKKVAAVFRAAADAWDFDKARANLFKRERDDAEAKIDRIANGIAVLGEENIALRKQYEVLRSGIRSLWHGVIDGDVDRLSVGYALKELFR